MYFNYLYFNYFTTLIACSSPQEDHHRAVAAVIRGLPPDWKRPFGRPNHTWLRAVEADLGQQNIGLASDWRKAGICDDWRRIVDTATLQLSMLQKKEEDVISLHKTYHKLDSLLLNRF